MATVLTKSYQRIATISLTYGEIRTYAKYTSQSTVNNKTTYYLKSTYYIPSQSYIRFDSATAKLDGTSKSYGSTTLNKGETTIQEVSRTITHNSDGSSPTKSVKTEWSATFGGSGTSTASISMPKINRIATVTNASDFTDEENPTLEFSNPAGFIVYPYLNFYDKDNNLVHQLIRKSESITSPYTWNITDEERSALWQSTNKQQTYKVNVGVDTYNGATKLGNNSKSQTMTYVNAEPSQTTLFTEIKQKVIDVLGTDTAETLIQNASKVTLVSTPEVKKEATVSKILFEHNNLSTEDKESPYGIMLDVVNSKFKVTIVDSRGYSIPTEYTKSIIQYIPINIDSFSFKRENSTSSNIKLNAQIRYKQATFGTNENVPTIKWKLGADGTLNTLTTSDYTIDTENDKITISNLVLENVLPYTSEGRFYLYVNDLLTEDTENEPVTRGTPTCDMGEHDFQVNGELYVADTNRENRKEIRDLFFPIGSTYVTSENVSPASYLSGTWKLFDKEMALKTSEAGENFTPNTTNVSAYQCVLIVQGHTLRCRLKWTNKVHYNDSEFEIGTINLSKIGVSAFPYGIFSYPVGSDGANAICLTNVSDVGVVKVTETISKNSGTTSATGENFYLEFTVPVPYEKISDSFCDKFYWKRVE